MWDSGIVGKDSPWKHLCAVFVVVGLHFQGWVSEYNSNKMFCVYVQPDSSSCPVFIFDLYLSKLPAQPKAFYMQPLSKVPSDPSKIVLWV